MWTGRGMVLVGPQMVVVLQWRVGPAGHDKTVLGKTLPGSRTVRVNLSFEA